MSDIVDELRNYDYRGNRPPEHAVMAEAADEIERLRGVESRLVDENERLRATRADEGSDQDG